MGRQDVFDLESEVPDNVVFSSAQLRKASRARAEEEYQQSQSPKPKEPEPVREQPARAPNRL